MPGIRRINHSKSDPRTRRAIAMFAQEAELIFGDGVTTDILGGISGGSIITINTDNPITVDTDGVGLLYDSTQFDLSSEGAFHIQHFHTPDTENTFLGVDTEDGSGSYNTFMGYHAGKGVDQGFNVMIGNQVGKVCTTSVANTCMGALTFSNATGQPARNTAIGYYNQVNAYSGAWLLSATGNTSIGAFCMSALETGLWNTAIGYYALSANKHGKDNMAIGSRSLFNLDPTERIITVFADAGGGQVTVTSTGHGLSNGDTVYISGTTNYDGTEVISNVAADTFEITHSWDGDDAAGFVTPSYEANKNMAIGANSMYSATIAAQNTCIGADSGYSLTTGLGNVFIGFKAGYSETTGSNKLYIENSNSATPLIYGEFDNDLLKINGQLEVLTASTPQLKLSYDGSNNATWSVDNSGDLTITASGGEVSFGGLNLATTGTLQAEQLTSTDDITMQGHLLTLGNNTATDIVITFDGSANDGTITFDESDNEFDFDDSAITTTGGATVDTLTLTAASQNWLITDQAENLAFQNQTAGQLSLVKYFTKDGDGTGLVGSVWFTKGSPASITNSEYVALIMNSTVGALINTTATGSGTVRTLKLYTGANFNQLVLMTNGSVGVGVTSTSHEFDVDGVINAQAGFSYADVAGWDGTFTNGDGDTVSVSGGIVIGVS